MSQFYKFEFQKINGLSLLSSFFCPYNGSESTLYDTALFIYLLMYILSGNIMYRDQSKYGTSSAVSRRYYFTSEQLFGPTGSLKQVDIAITAASIDASSPFSFQ